MYVRMKVRENGCTDAGKNRTFPLAARNILQKSVHYASGGVDAIRSVLLDTRVPCMLGLN